MPGLFYNKFSTGTTDCRSMLTKHFAQDNRIVRHCKTVEILFLPDILSCSAHIRIKRAATTGAERGRRPPKQNFRPLKCPACPVPTQTPLSLAAVLRCWLFFLRSTENSEKSRPTQKFWPPQKQTFTS